MKEALGHHVEGLIRARFPEEGSRREAPGVQEFISKEIKEIQEGRILQGDCRQPRGAAHCPGEGREFRVCIDMPGFNRAASQQLIWPSCVDRCEGPAHSYVRMPCGLPGAAVVFQRYMRDALAACEARHQTTLAEMEEHPQEPPGPSGPPEAWGQGGS